MVGAVSWEGGCTTSARREGRLARGHALQAQPCLLEHVSVSMLRALPARVAGLVLLGARPARLCRHKGIRGRGGG